MKYLILKDQPHWKAGDIVDVNNNAAKALEDAGIGKPYNGESVAQHVWVLVDPTMVKPIAEELLN